MITIWKEETFDEPWEWFGLDNSIFNDQIDFTPLVVAGETVHYGIEIDVSDNTDIADEKEIGLFQDALLRGDPSQPDPDGGSAFRWVTERPDYDGSTVVPTGDLSTTNAIKWAEGMMTPENDLGNPIRLININIAGAYGSLSGFQFSVDNVRIESGNFSGELFFDVLDDNNIRLLNRKIRFYIIINDVFFNVWSGIISKTDHSETRFSVTCEDDFKNLHKTIPPQQANETLFPKILKKSIGKTIPVAFGQVNHARLINVQTIKEPINLSIGSDGIDRSIGLIHLISENVDSNGNPTDTTLTVTIGTKSFVLNELLGKHLRIVLDGGSDNFYEITSTSASFFFPTVSQNVITININVILESDDFTLFTGSESTFSDTKKFSWVEIFDFESIYIVSTNLIDDFPNSEKGHTAKIDFFDKDQEEFFDVSEAGEFESETNIQQTGFPGLVAFTDSTANNGTFLKQFVFKPKSIKMGTVSPNVTSSPHTVTFNDFPAIGEDVPKLIDRDKASKHTVIFQRPSSGGDPGFSSSVGFQIELPENLDAKNFDEFYIVTNYDLTAELNSNSSFDRAAQSDLPKSIHQIFGGFRIDPQFLNGTFLAGVALQIRLIHPLHFNETGQPGNLLQSISSALDLTAFYLSEQEYKAYPFLDFRLLIKNNAIVATTEDLTMDVFEIALAGIRQLSISDDNIFVKAVGEIIGTNTTLNVNRIFEAILKTYDEITAADITNDFTDPNNDDISSRLTWTAGRQLIERKSSFTYLKELAEQSFVGIFPSRIGKRSLRAYRDFQTATINFAHDNGNIIKDSISRFELTPINEVFNEFDIKYEHNVANGRFDKSIFIKNVDQSAFPARFKSTGTDLASPGDFTAHADVTITVPLSGDASAVITYASVDAAFVVGLSVSLDDSAGIGAFDFGTIIDVTATTVTVTFNNKGLSNGDSTATGIVHIHGTSVPEWTTFTGGFSNYSTGLDLWTVCRNSFLRTLVVRQLPDSFSNCKWFIDEANFDGDQGEQSTPHKYLALLVEWATRQKELVEFSIPITTANVVLELLEFVTFRDQKFTANELRNGYITKIKPDPRSDTIILELTLIPADIESVTDCVIVESGLQPDTITETGLQPDTITETGTC